jgi:hypothetical protein
VSCPLSLYKESHGAPPCTHNHTINTMQKATHWLDVEAITRKRARTSIKCSSLYVTVEFCVRRIPPNIAPDTPVASCRSSNTTPSKVVWQIWISKHQNFSQTFGTSNDFKWKTHQLQSCSHRDLQLWFWLIFYLRLFENFSFFKFWNFIYKF